MTYNVNNIRKVHLVPHYLWSTISWSELNLDESDRCGFSAKALKYKKNRVVKLKF